MQAVCTSHITFQEASRLYESCPAPREVLILHQQSDFELSDIILGQGDVRFRLCFLISFVQCFWIFSNIKHRNPKIESCLISTNRELCTTPTKVKTYSPQMMIVPFRPADHGPKPWVTSNFFHRIDRVEVVHALSSVIEQTWKIPLANVHQNGERKHAGPHRKESESIKIFSCLVSGPEIVYTITLDIKFEFKQKHQAETSLAFHLQF